MMNSDLLKLMSDLVDHVGPLGCQSQIIQKVLQLRWKMGPCTWIGSRHNDGGQQHSNQEKGAGSWVLGRNNISNEWWTTYLTWKMICHMQKCQAICIFCRACLTIVDMSPMALGCTCSRSKMITQQPKKQQHCRVFKCSMREIISLGFFGMV